MWIELCTMAGSETLPDPLEMMDRGDVWITVVGVVRVGFRSSLAQIRISEHLLRDFCVDVFQLVGPQIFVPRQLAQRVTRDGRGF